MNILLISHDFEDQFSQIIPTTDMMNNSVDSLSDSKHCFQSQYINNAHIGADGVIMVTVTKISSKWSRLKSQAQV